MTLSITPRLAVARPQVRFGADEGSKEAAAKQDAPKPTEAKAADTVSITPTPVKAEATTPDKVEAKAPETVTTPPAQVTEAKPVETPAKTEAPAQRIDCPNIAQLDAAVRPQAETLLNQLNENLAKLKTHVMASNQYSPDTYYPVQAQVVGFNKAIDGLRELIKPTAAAPMRLVVSKSDLLEKTQLLGFDLRQVKLESADGKKVSLKGSVVQWSRMHDADLTNVDPTGANFYQTAISPETKLAEGMSLRKNDLMMERHRLKKLLKPVGEFISRKTEKPRAWLKAKNEALKAGFHKKFDGTLIGKAAAFMSKLMK